MRNRRRWSICGGRRTDPATVTVTIMICTISISRQFPLNLGDHEVAMTTVSMIDWAARITMSGPASRAYSAPTTHSSTGPPAAGRPPPPASAG